MLLWTEESLSSSSVLFTTIAAFLEPEHSQNLFHPTKASLFLKAWKPCLYWLLSIRHFREKEWAQYLLGSVGRAVCWQYLLALCRFLTTCSAVKQRYCWAIWFSVFSPAPPSPAHQSSSWTSLSPACSDSRCSTASCACSARSSNFRPNADIFASTSSSFPDILPPQSPGLCLTSTNFGICACCALRPVWFWEKDFRSAWRW